ncbi:solute carrier family 23 protein, partial [Escherichia coli]
ALMGLKNTGVIVANKDTLVMIGDLSSHGVLLGILGFFIITVLSSRHFHAAVLVSIVVTSCCGLFFGDVHFSGVYSIPPDISGVIGEVDLSGALTLELAGIIFSFMLINLFDSSGTLIGVTDKAGLIDGNGKFPNMNKALYVDSVSSVAGAFIGTSSVTAYIESTSGVAVGGRTGLTAVVVGVMFLLVMFFSPLVAMVPPYATAGALIFVGVLMTSSLARVIWGLTFALVPVGWSTWITRSLADQAEKAGSIQVAVIQLANTCGAAIGGYALDNIGLTSPLMLSGTLMLLTALLVTAKVKMKKS